MCIRDRHNTWVTGYSVEARLRERPRAGRPKRKPAASAEDRPQALEA